MLVEIYNLIMPQWPSQVCLICAEGL